MMPEESGLDGLTLGLIIGGAVLALKLIAASVFLVMKRKRDSFNEVQKHPLPDKTATEMTTNPQKSDKDDLGDSSQKLSEDGSQLELESVDDDSDDTEKDSKSKKEKK